MEILLRRARSLDAMQFGKKAQIVLFDMLPAMIRGDLVKMGDALFDLCYLGSKRAECEQHGDFGTPRPIIRKPILKRLWLAVRYRS